MPFHLGKEMSLSSENSFDEVPLSPSVGLSKSVDMDEIAFNENDASVASSYSKGKPVFGTTLRSPINDFDEDENLYDDK